MPGHKIPSPYRWDASFKTFYDNIDAEHKSIFDCIFECDADRGNAGKLKQLIKVTTDHFSEEEKMMQDASYGAYAQHKPLHTAFLGKINALSCPLSEGNVDFAKDWLVQHIMDTDFLYKGKL